MMKLYTVLLLIYASALAHSSVESPRTRAPLDQPNILLIVLDDVGIDRFPGYGVHPVPMRMPVMERLINRGIRFNRVWSMPNCSPTRASLLTGRFPSRHGVYRAVSPDDDDAVELDTAEVTLPRVLPGYRSSAVGKWHLKAPNTSGVHPLLCGFGHHAGSLYNVGGGGYSNWERTVDGTPGMENRYASTVASTDALRLAQQLLPEPWLLYVSYNAAHAPFHVPPQHLHSYGNPTDKITRFRAMCEAMDTEIGRLLAGVDLDNTLVIVLGDNGTPGQVSTGPWPADHAKGSLYEGGVRVPMVIAGPGVVHGTSQALISVTDLHRTLVEYTGGHYQAEDSISFLPLLQNPASPGARQFLYAESGNPNGGGVNGLGHSETASDGRWKLIRRSDGDEFYDLQQNLLEAENLLGSGNLSPEAQRSFDKLERAIEAL